jgi:hypothetical protein
MNTLDEFHLLEYGVQCSHPSQVWFHPQFYIQAINLISNHLQSKNWA